MRKGRKRQKSRGMMLAFLDKSKNVLGYTKIANNLYSWSVAQGYLGRRIGDSVIAEVRTKNLG